MSTILARRSTRLALCFLGVLVLLAVFADLLASSQPLVARAEDGLWVLPAVTSPHRFAGRSSERIEAELGDHGWAVWAPIRASAAPATADVGARNVMAELVFGARTVTLATLATLAIALVLGLLLGTLAGFGGSLADAVLARAVELSGALPTLVALAVVRTWHAIPAFVAFLLVIGALRGIELARLMRGEVLRVHGQDFVVAARALGVPPLRVLTRHVLPHALGPLLVSAALTAAHVVGLEAALSFVGLGLAPELPSWGGVLGQIDGGLSASAVLLPALAIVATTAALYRVADALDDALSARRGRAR